MRTDPILPKKDGSITWRSGLEICKRCLNGHYEPCQKKDCPCICRRME